MSKISFRFYKDHEVRAIWDEANSKWWFSVQDVVGAINDQNDHKKNRNYWKYLKTRLRKDGNELVSATNQLKLRAADGKRYSTDVLDAEGIRLLAKYTIISTPPISLTGSPIVTILSTDRARRKRIRLWRVGCLIRWSLGTTHGAKTDSDRCNKACAAGGWSCFF